MWWVGEPNERKKERCKRLHVYITTREQLCLGDERPGRADDVNMVHISQKSLPVSSDEAMVLKIQQSDPGRIQALDSISSTDP
jgi:hypothetical protein